MKKIRLCKEDPREHFLDYSIDKYGQQLVKDTKILFEILQVFLLMPIFWALYDQIGSSWVEQATKMNGNIGSYKILPDQMQILNAIFDIMFTPMLDCCIYPIFSKFGIRNLLQKLAIGGIFGVISFAMTAIVQWQVETKPHEIHILWQIPQYIFITLGEILFTVPAISYSYERSPEGMKTIVEALRIFAAAFGSALVAIINSVNYFNSLTHVFIFFMFLMLLDTLCLMMLAAKFKKVNSQKNDEDGE